MPNLITTEQWLKNRDIDVSHYVRKKDGCDYIQWGDLEYLLETQDIRFTYQYTIDWGHSFIELKLFREGAHSVTYFYAITEGFTNKTVKEPDARAVNDNLQRALVKAVAREFGFGHQLFEKEYHEKRGTKTGNQKRAAMKQLDTEVPDQGRRKSYRRT